MNVPTAANGLQPKKRKICLPGRITCQGAQASYNASISCLLSLSFKGWDRHMPARVVGARPDAADLKPVMLYASNGRA